MNLERSDATMGNRKDNKRSGAGHSGKGSSNSGPTSSGGQRSDSGSRGPGGAAGKRRPGSGTGAAGARYRGKPTGANRRPTSTPVLTLDEPVRLNRYIASSGTCSRREADDLINQGLIKLNGEVVSELGTKVSKGDRVMVNGKHIVPVDREYLLMNKPTDTITTTSDEKGRRSVMDLLDAQEYGTLGLFPVGRLDRHTTGALLLTNDGDLAHRLMHPSYVVSKQYLIETRDPVDEKQLTALQTGVELEDGIAKADRVSYADDASPTWLVMSLHEGRNRQVRRMLEALGNEVVKLDRVRYAGLTTKGIRKGRWRRLSRDEVAVLYRKVKL